VSYHCGSDVASILKGGECFGHKKEESTSQENGSSQEKSSGQESGSSQENGSSQEKSCHEETVVLSGG